MVEADVLEVVKRDNAQGKVWLDNFNESLELFIQCDACTIATKEMLQMDSDSDAFINQKCENTKWNEVSLFSDLRDSLKDFTKGEPYSESAVEYGFLRGEINVKNRITHDEKQISHKVLSSKKLRCDQSSPITTTPMCQNIITPANANDTFDKESLRQNIVTSDNTNDTFDKG